MKPFRVKSSSFGIGCSMFDIILRISSGTPFLITSINRPYNNPASSIQYPVIFIVLLPAKSVPFVVNSPPMIEIGKSIVSSELLTSHFTCNLHACKGACCVMGDSGAPLEDDEVEILREIYPRLKPFLSEESIATIEKSGTSVVDFENDKVTPLNNGKECAYVVFKDGIAFCAIEQAYNEGAVKFRKPISCHLYPGKNKKIQGI